MLVECLGVTAPRKERPHVHCRDFAGPVGFLQDSIKKFSCPEQGLSFAVLHCQTVEHSNPGCDVITEENFDTAATLAAAFRLVRRQEAHTNQRSNSAPFLAGI